MASSFAVKFERLLEQYRKPDGGKWSTRELEEATGGFAGSSYVANLRAGRIRRPGYDKLKALSGAMGFPVSLWYEEPGEWPRLSEKDQRMRGPSLAQRLEMLMDISRNELTGEPFTEEEVVRLSFGTLTLEELRQVRSGELTNPTMSQLYALSDVFGVDVYYWTASGERLPDLSSENMEAIRDEKTRLILNKMHGRSEGEKDMILAVIQQLERLHDNSGRASEP